MPFCIYSGFSEEFVSALGAADIDPSLALGDAHLLVTFGAAVIAVLPVLQTAQKIAL